MGERKLLFSHCMTSCQPLCWVLQKHYIRHSSQEPLEDDNDVHVSVGLRRFEEARVMKLALNSDATPPPSLFFVYCQRVAIDAPLQN